MIFQDRPFLSLLDYSSKEIVYLLNLAAKLKKEKQDGIEQQRLKGKQIALVFEKDSTRTRCATEVAARDQGAFSTFLGTQGNQIGVKESIKDTARVLGSMYDAILYRGFDQSRINTLAEHAGVPVYNGLTNEFHPTQALADLLTLKECCNKPLNDITWAYLGDASNNVAASILVASSIMGINLRIIAPDYLMPNPNLISQCTEIASNSGANLLFTNSPEKGLIGCDAVYTDVWLSMGEDKSLWSKRISTLKPYQVNKNTMALTLNPNTIFMHCLPAFHNSETEVTQQIFNEFGISELEVTEAVFESEQSVVFQQAENRLHTIKAIMVATLE